MSFPYFFFYFENVKTLKQWLMHHASICIMHVDSLVCMGNQMVASEIRECFYRHLVQNQIIS